MVKRRQIVRFSSALLAVIVVFMTTVVASAKVVKVFDYNDYITDVVVDGDNDVITCVFGADALYPAWRHDDVTTGAQDIVYGSTASFDVIGANDNRFIYFPMYYNGYFLDIAQIPDDTTFVFTFNLDVDFGDYGYDTPQAYCYYRYYDSNGTSIGTKLFSLGSIGDYRGDGTDYVIPVSSAISKPEGAVYFNLNFFCNGFTTLSGRDSTVACEAGGLQMKFSISSLLRLQQESQKTNSLLTSIESHLASQGQTMEDILQAQDQTNDKLDGIQDTMDDTNDKLDDLISGGDAGEDLSDGSSGITDGAGDLQDSMDQVQEFEDQYIGDFQDNLDQILADFSLDLLSAPLNFVQGYLNRIIQAVPPAYMVVFTLPMLLGLLLYILGHPVRVPSPAAARSGGKNIPDESIKLKSEG